MLQCLHENGLFYDRKQLKQAKRVLVQSRKTNSLASSTQYINYGMSISNKCSCIRRYTFQCNLLMLYVIMILAPTIYLAFYSMLTRCFFEETIKPLNLKYPCNFNIVLSVTLNDCNYMTNKKRQSHEK